MNRLQVARQLKSTILALTWADSSRLFPTGGVYVSLGMTQKAIAEKRPPLCLIRPGAVQPDPEMSGERPDLVRIEFGLTVAVSAGGDGYGELPLIGGNRTGGSKGRGLLEVEEVLLAAIFQVGPAAGFPIIFRSSSQAAPQYDEEMGGYVAWGDYNFEALGTLSRTYQEPSGLAATVAGATVNLAWNAAVRFDARRFILRRAAGATPPATSSSGTGVTLGGTPDGAGVSSKADTPGSGTWSYSLFAVYDDTGAGSDVAISAPQSVVSVVVP